MSDKQMLIELPEELLQQVTSANLDVRAIVEKALLAELGRRMSSPIEQHSRWDDTAPPLTLEEKEALALEILPPERHELALKTLRAGEHISSLYSGQIGHLDEAMEPLPEEIWGDLFQ